MTFGLEKVELKLGGARGGFNFVKKIKMSWFSLICLLTWCFLTEGAACTKPAFCHTEKNDSTV